MVKSLRSLTGAPVLECKNALRAAEVNGDLNLAIEWLRKRGVQLAAKKQSRNADEGLIGLLTKQDTDRRTTAVSLVELRSETDFVARNESFQQLMFNILDLNFDKKASSVNEIENESLATGNETVSEGITQLAATVGEKIELKNVTFIEAEKMDQTKFTVLGTYLHNKMGDVIGARAGVIALEVDLSKNSVAGPESEIEIKNRTEELANKLAMQLVGGSALFLTHISEAFKEKEREIEAESTLKEMTEASGKKQVDEAVLSKRVAKKVDKKISQLEKEIILHKQMMISGEGTVAKLLKDTEKALKINLSIRNAIRYEVGGDNQPLQ